MNNQVALIKKSLYWLNSTGINISAKGRISSYLKMLPSINTMIEDYDKILKINEVGDHVLDLFSK